MLKEYKVEYLTCSHFANGIEECFVYATDKKSALADAIESCKEVASDAYSTLDDAKVEIVDFAIGTGFEVYINGHLDHWYMDFYVEEVA